MLFTLPEKLLLDIFFFLMQTLLQRRNILCDSSRKQFQTTAKFVYTDVSEGREDSEGAPLCHLCSPLFSLPSGLQRVPEHQSRAPIIAPNILNNKADVVSQFHKPFGNIFFLLMSTFSPYMCLFLLPQGGFYSHCISYYGSKMPNQTTTLQ